MHQPVNGWIKQLFVSSSSNWMWERSQSNNFKEEKKERKTLTDKPKDKRYNEVETQYTTTWFLLSI
jgi:hypothetical protein